MLQQALLVNTSFPMPFHTTSTPLANDCNRIRPIRNEHASLVREGVPSGRMLIAFNRFVFTEKKEDD
jgi:hypothetical protein